MTRCQQNEVYAAQERLGQGRKFASLIEVDTYLEEVLATDWWAERFPRVKDVEVFARGAGTHRGVATWYPDTWMGHVELAPDGRTERTLIHELAHVCAHAEHGHKAHGPAFVGIFLELTYRLRGVDDWTTLRDSMLAEGVTW